MKIIVVIITSLVILNLILFTKNVSCLRENEKISDEMGTFLDPSTLMSFEQSFLINKKRIPNINLKREFSKETTFEECLNKKKTVLLLYSERTCNSCIDSLIYRCNSLYINLDNSYQIFGVALSNDPQANKKFNKIKKISFPILWDYEDKLVKTLEIKTLPTILIIDENGNIENSFFMNPSVDKMNPIFFNSAITYF